MTTASTCASFIFAASLHWSATTHWNCRRLHYYCYVPHGPYAGMMCPKFFPGAAMEKGNRERAVLAARGER